MSRPDKQVKIILILLLILYFFILIIEIAGYRSPNYMSLLNALSGSAVLLYWINKQLRITQHFYELRETLVLLLEVLFVGVAGYTFFSSVTGTLLKIIQYTIFGIHFTALLLFLIYMLTFKMKKLF